MWSRRNTDRAGSLRIQPGTLFRALSAGFLMVALSCDAISIRVLADSPREEIKPTHRALCITSGCLLTSRDKQTQAEVPFGTLFKVSEIIDERCFVYNAHHAGWVPTGHLMSLSDPQLLSTIEKSAKTDADREYALGNYWIRRHLVEARRHFERSASLDPSRSHALVDLLFVLRSLGDNQAVRETLRQLDAFPERTDIVLVEALSSTPSEAALREIEELSQKSQHLRFAFIHYLLRQKDPFQILRGKERAEELFAAHPYRPANAYLAAQASQALVDHLDAHELKLKAIDQATAYTLESVRRDPTYWRGYENLAYIFRSKGNPAGAIRFAETALRMNPRAFEAARIIASFADAAESGEVFTDATGTVIPTEDILAMRGISQGLYDIRNLDLPLLPTHNESEEYLRIHGDALVPNGVDIEPNGMTALHLLVTQRNGSCLHYLSQRYSLDWNHPDRGGNPPLVAAATSNDVSVVDLMIKCGADPSVCIQSGRSCTAFAIEHSNLPLIAVLLNSDSLSAADQAALRKYFSLSETASVAETKKQASQQLQSMLDYLVESQLAHLAFEHKRSFIALHDSIEHERLMKFGIPLNNAPLLISSEIQADAAQFPARANVRLIQQLQRETEQFLHSYDLQLASLNEQTHTLEQRTEALRKASIDLADGMVACMELCLSQSEDAEYTKRTQEKVRSLLRNASIRWSPTAN